MDQCRVCEKAVARYTCPGCRCRTCSLGCVREHRERYGCLGRRDVAEFVPARRYGDLQGWQDVNYLTEVHDQLAGLRKRKQGIEGGEHLLYYGNGVSSLHPLIAASERPKKGKTKSTALAEACQASKVRLHLMPVGMKRHGQNRSRALKWQAYCHFAKSAREKVEVKEVPVVILWTLELAWNDNTKVVNNVPDFTSMKGIIRQHLPPDLDTVVPYLSNPFQPALRQLELETTIKEALRGSDVVEYPTFVFSKQTMETKVPEKPAIADDLDQDHECESDSGSSVDSEGSIESDSEHDSKIDSDDESCVHAPGNSTDMASVSMQESQSSAKSSSVLPALSIQLERITPRQSAPRALVDYLSD